MFRTAYLYIRLFYHIRRHRKNLTDDFNHNAKYMKDLSMRCFKYGGKTLEVVGLENLPKEDGVLYVANHQSFFDIYASVVAIDKQVAFMGKEAMRKFFHVGEFLESTGGVLIDRDDVKSQMKSLRQFVNIIKDGYNAIIFPEGTRSKDGKLNEFKAGSFRIAQKAKCKIVPITLYQNHLVASHKKKVVYLKVDKEIEYETFKDMSTLDVAEMVKEIIQNNLDEGFDRDEAVKIPITI